MAAACITQSSCMAQAPKSLVSPREVRRATARPESIGAPRGLPSCWTHRQSLQKSQRNVNTPSSELEALAQA
eukprot:2703974-Amphidinium_carterae.3